MGDAAEVLTALYEKLAAVAAEAGESTMLDDHFGLHVKVKSAWCSYNMHGRLRQQQGLFAGMVRML